jgi:hypothetical protein
MAYSLSGFLRAPKEAERMVRIYNDVGAATYFINPYSVLRLYTTTTNLNIVLTNKRSVVLDFPSEQETSSAMVALQARIDYLLQTAPQVINNAATEDFVQTAIQNSGLAAMNGLTASEQGLSLSLGPNLVGEVISVGTTHSISIRMSGVIPLTRGGTNNISFKEGELLQYKSGKIISTGYSIKETGNFKTVGPKEIWPADKIISSAIQLAKDEMTNNIFEKEVPKGNLDGVNCRFDLSADAVLKSEMVYLNGLLQMSGQDYDYFMDGKTIVFIDPPTPGMRIICSYRKKGIIFQ